MENRQARADQRIQRDFSDQRQDRQQNREQSLGDRQENRNERREDRRDYRDEVRDDRQDFLEDRYDDWDDDHWGDGDWDGGELLVAGAVVAGAVAIGTAFTYDYVYSQPCTVYEIEVSGVLYYQCGTTWYNRAYAGSSVSYVVVNPPPGY